MSPKRLSARVPASVAGMLLSGLLAGCLGDPLPAQSPDFAMTPYPDWRAEDQFYRFYPGDKFRVDVRTAPELSSEMTIAPDGRVSLPTIGPVMASGKTMRELQASVEEIYGNELRDPSVVITPMDFGSQKVFVGGEVKQPGVFELPGEIDVLQAILLAGGWTEEGSPTQVIVMRRKPGGEMMTRVLDVRNGLARQALYDIGPLKRFDVVYVTRSWIADQNQFVRQYVRAALPIDFSLFYDVARF
jgi:protein involved in polysaccharide export with SLBB domain